MSLKNAGRKERVVWKLVAIMVVGIGLISFFLTTHQMEQKRKETSSTVQTKRLGVNYLNHHAANGLLALDGALVEGQNPDHAWQSALLPYCDQHKIYSLIDPTKPWDAEENRAAFESVVQQFLNPEILDQRFGSRTKTSPSRGYALSHFSLNDQLQNSDVPLKQMEDITDGAGSTIILGEIAGHFPEWGKPGNARDVTSGVNKSLDGFGSANKKGAHFMMGDGSVRWISNDVSPEVLSALASPRSEEVESSEG